MAWRCLQDYNCTPNRPSTQTRLKYKPTVTRHDATSADQKATPFPSKAGKMMNSGNEASTSQNERAHTLRDADHDV